MINDIILIIGIIASILGCLVVACNKALWANWIWAIFNPFMAIYNIRIKEYEQAGLWSLYVIIALFGLIKHYTRRKK